MEKLKDFFNKNIGKFLFFSMFLLILIIIYFIGENENKIKEYYKIFFITIGTIYIVYSFFFNLKKTEIFLIKNITLISISSIIIILIFQKDLGIKENDKILIMIGAIFAFWYGYKKYEINKEFELLNKFSISYKLLKKENKKDEIIDLWYDEFHLYKLGYLSDNLWNSWKISIANNFKIYITEDIKEFYTIKNIEKYCKNYFFLLSEDETLSNDLFINETQLAILEKEENSFYYKIIKTARNNIDFLIFIIEISEINIKLFENAIKNSKILIDGYNKIVKKDSKNFKSIIEKDLKDYNSILKLFKNIKLELEKKLNLIENFGKKKLLKNLKKNIYNGFKKLTLKHNKKNYDI